ncbi:MAG: hypothetical protein Q7V05_01480, partial [Methanoregula sp.]|nr:hypothetical protein [Methanoregula sp.]
GRPRGGYLTGFVVGFTESIFDKIDIFERLGIFASSEILADCVTRPKICNRILIEKIRADLNLKKFAGPCPENFNRPYGPYLKVAYRSTVPCPKIFNHTLIENF